MKWAGVVLVLVLLAALLALGRLVQTYGMARARWQDSTEVLAEARAKADRVAKAAEVATLVEQRRVWQLNKEIERLQQKVQPVKVIRDTLVVPDTCKVIVEPLYQQIELRDSVIRLKNEYLASYDAQLVYAYQKNTAAVVRLAELEHQLKRPKRSVFLPSLGVGAAIGADVTGKPNMVVGLTVGWRF